MKAIKNINLLLVMFLTISLSVTAQNQLRVNAFASSALSEGSFSWFMDYDKISGSRLTVQVKDGNRDEFLSGCTINIEVCPANNPELIVDIPASDVHEIEKGLYVMAGSGGYLMLFLINRAKYY